MIGDQLTISGGGGAWGDAIRYQILDPLKIKYQISQQKSDIRYLTSPLYL